MEWLRFRDLERHYGAREIFSGVSGVLRDGERIGLVGPNGAGKSSLVRILAGIDEPDGGEFARPRDSHLGYLSQAASERSDSTLRALLASAFERIHAHERELRSLEVELAAASERGDRAAEERLMRRYGTAHEAFERHGGAAVEYRMNAMVDALGFTQADLDRPIAEFSGGQRTRAMLARVLLEEPDYFILDEPTNHLDIETVTWLEGFIREDPRAFLIVSHDRLFLDRVATAVWELDRGTLTAYTPAANAYTSYVEEKEVRAEQALREYEKSKAELDRRKAVIAELRTHGSHNYNQVRSREKQLAKSAPLEAPPERGQRLSVALESARIATTGIAVTAKGLSKRYGDLALFSKLGFELARGERLAILGPNGAGKSTLLRLLAGAENPDAGSIRFGTGMRVATFSQNAADELPEGVTAVEAVMGSSSADDFTARSLLGRLGLGGDSGDKPVDAFSGGERRRIMLARLMASSADLLLLDEPTNDLDIPSREALESVLASYGGAMIVVSHDRYLLRRLIDRFIWLHDGTWTSIEGGFEAYERAEIAVKRGGVIDSPVAKKTSAADTPRDTSKRSERAKRDVEKWEAEVARLDARRAGIEREFADPVLYEDPRRVAKLREELEATEKAAATALERWERAVEAVES